MKKKMHQKKISVIVPVYKVEKYIHRCVESLLKQTYSNIEIVLVDDGSPDSCGGICDYFAEKDQRIKVIHKENGGLSSARNAGLKIASGEYIGFVDSDDWVETAMYEKMILFLESEQCDVVECGVNLVCDNKCIEFVKKENEAINGKEALYRHLEGKSSERLPRVAVWSKLYKKEFWDGREFPEGKIHEDYMITCECLYTSKKVGFLKEGLYNHYVDNAGSIMHSQFGKKDLYLEEQYYNRVEYLRSNGELGLSELAERLYYMLLISLYWRCSENNMEEQGYYFKVLKDSYHRVRKLKLPRKRYLEYIIIIWLPGLYGALRKVYNKNLKKR